MALNAEQRERYHRHLILDGFGEAAQERLRSARVLCVGAGGLGSPALLYLAAAGVGTIGVIDDDVVDRSNLQRQIVHRDDACGQPKTASAAAAMRALDPTVRVVEHHQRFTAENAASILADYDLVLDGADNFPTRYLVNDAAVLTQTPCVHGAIFGFEGQVSVFEPAAGSPCYRCLFPEPPPPGSVPSCAEAGVLGVLPGVVGTMMATEAIKRLAGIGDLLYGRLLRYDALSMTTMTLELAREPNCALCGDHPSITTISEIPWACDTEPVADRLTPEAYRDLRASDQPHLLLDVREPWEIARGNLPGHRNIPAGELPDRITELSGERDALIVCLCQGGVRSLKARDLLREAGFSNVTDILGGWNSLADLVEHTSP